MHEIVVQLSSQPTPAPQKLDLSKTYQEVALEAINLPATFNQSPVQVITLAPGLTVLAQRDTGKLIIYETTTLNILLDVANPIGQYRVPEIDGKDLMLFITGGNSNGCLFRFNTVSRTLDPINSIPSVCDNGMFSEKHIIVFDQGGFNFYSKENFQNLNYPRIADLDKFSHDEQFVSLIRSGTSYPITIA